MKRLLFSLLIATSLLAQTTPPAPSAPREAKLPQPMEKTLANGLRVIVVPKHDIPLVAARLMIKTGAAADPANLDGLASLTATAVTKGTKTRSAEQIARGVEALGATLTSDAGWDNTSVDLSVMSSNLAAAMAFVADVARNATFAEDEFERERAQAVDALQVELTEPRPVAGLAMSRLIFGDGPYAHNASGSVVSLGRLGRLDLAKFHGTHYRPDNAVLVFAGDVKAADAFKLAESQFGGWKNVGRASARPPAKLWQRPDPKPRVVVIDMPESGQAAVVVGRKGIRRIDPAYMTSTVANSVLGAGYSSRLNQEIRIKRGLSYGAGSSFEPRVDAGPFTARTETKHESAAEVAGILVKEMSQLSVAAVPEAELTPRKAALIGGFAQSLETASGIVTRVSSLALYGLPLSDINRYVSGVQAVTAEDVQKFAEGNLRGEDAQIVIAGDASKFLEPLRKQFSEVEVIKAEELDLSSPTLRVRKSKK